MHKHDQFLQTKTEEYLWKVSRTSKSKCINRWLECRSQWFFKLQKIIINHMTVLEKGYSMIIISKTMTQTLKRGISLKSFRCLKNTSFESSWILSEGILSISFEFLRFSSKADRVDLRTFWRYITWLIDLLLFFNSNILVQPNMKYFLRYMLWNSYN